MLYLFSLSVFFHPSLTSVRLRWHRALIFMEDSVTLISVTYERLSLACQLLSYNSKVQCLIIGLLTSMPCYVLSCGKAFRSSTIGYENDPGRFRKHSPELLTP